MSWQGGHVLEAVGLFSVVSVDIMSGEDDFSAETKDGDVETVHGERDEM